MQTTLTERDKKLLIFLSLFVIIVGIGYWGLRPIYKDIKQINEDTEEAQALKEVNERKLSELPIYERDNKDLEENIVKARQSFYPVMTADEIDKMFTGMALDYNLYSYSLRISIDKDELESKPYKFSAKANEEDEEEDLPPEELDTYDAQAVDDYAEDQYAQPQFEEKPTTGIIEARVNMQVGGKRNDLQRLIDDLSVTEEKMLLNSYTWDRSSEIVKKEDGTFEIDNSEKLDFSISVFMYKE